MKQYIWKDLNQAQRQDVLKRPEVQGDQSVEDIVAALLLDVKEGGDAAIRDITKRLDQYDPDPLCVDLEAPIELSDQMRAAIDQAYKNLRTFHEKQGYQPYHVETMEGLSCARKVVPIERIGVYVPGGTAPLISTSLMACVPAQLAGCREISLYTPAQNGVDPAILYAAKLCGVTRVVRVGGVPAIAAMAQGTETLPAVDKIVGPGNSFVAEAKIQVSKTAGGPAIDLPAGPSEALVIVDETSNPAYAAADLLAQAEHDVVAQVVLVSTTQAQIDAVQDEVEAQLAALPRADIARAAMENSVAFLVDDLDEALALSNQYAPEHLLLSFDGAERYLAQVQNAGSVFCGVMTPESFGDYASGTNHVLPTGGAARAYSGLTVEAFQKTITVQTATNKGFAALAETVIVLAEAEGLEAHAGAVKVEFKKDVFLLNKIVIFLAILTLITLPLREGR